MYVLKTIYYYAVIRTTSRKLLGEDFKMKSLKNESISVQKPSIVKPNNKAIDGTDSFDILYL
jgi:hypothetical protein